MSRQLLCAALITLSIAMDPAHIFGDKPMVALELGGRRIEGTPLVWSKTDALLLARDGHLWNFHPSEAASYRKVSDHFTSLSAADMRLELRNEFGKNYDVSGTGHYLVVHPKGERNDWAPRFEELYRNFMRYFTARGLEPTAPQFPLVAIVFRTERDFQKYAQQTGAKLISNTLGFYSPVTNRIMLYDVTAGQKDDPQWQINAETIVHEAIHQMAFNTGVHSRYAGPPRWVAEGLGTVFEAKGVWNSKRYSEQSDRINRYRFEEFKSYAATRRKAGALADFVTSDRSFESDPGAAYAEAWALSFFLFETQPKKYVDYLRTTASRPQFTEYRSPERVAEFSRYFGADLRQVENRFLKFMSNLK